MANLMIDKTLPQGAISEVFGGRSSGKTALLHAFLAEATGAGECCAVVDVRNAFDPFSAAQNDVDLRKLLWVRGSGRVDQAFKSVDMLIHAGGFGVVVLDLCDVEPQQLNRIPLSYWYRFRLAVQNTPTRLIVTGEVPLAKSCSRMRLETARQRIEWKGPVLDGIVSLALERKGRPGIAPEVRLPMVG